MFSWISQGLSNVGNSLTTFINNVTNFFGQLFTKLGNWFTDLTSDIGVFFSNLGTNLSSWFSNLISSMGDFFGSLGSSLGSWFSTLFTNLGNILSYINPFSENFLGKKIIELLGDLLELLFVPSSESITNLTDSVKSKFAFTETISVAVNSMKDIITGVSSAPRFSINLNATKFTNAGNYVVVDLEWYRPFKTYGDTILTGIIYALYLWRLYINLPNIISGTGASIQGIDSISKSNIGGGRNK